jgi:hypothetical protein
VNTQQGDGPTASRAAADHGQCVAPVRTLTERRTLVYIMRRA